MCCNQTKAAGEISGLFWAAEAGVSILEGDLYLTLPLTN